MIKRNKRRLVPSLNTTSTADISFMLLIFFLVTTSMDLDKGLRRVLPPVDNQQQQQETNIDKDKLMAITITDADSAFVDGKPLEMKTLRKQVRDFVARVGKSHLITINAQPMSSYDTYFKIQNEIVAAYADIRNGIALKKYSKPYSKLSAKELEVVKNMCPQRISEQYNMVTEAQGGEK